MIFNPAAPAQPAPAPENQGAAPGGAPGGAPARGAAPAQGQPKASIPGMPPIVMQLIEALKTIYGAMKDGGAPPEDVQEMRDIVDRLVALFQKVGQRRLAKQGQPGQPGQAPVQPTARPAPAAPISRPIPQGSKPGAMPVV